jgi:hypothetical protein
LGKELQGMHEHIKVVKKDDVKGVRNSRYNVDVVKLR